MSKPAMKPKTAKTLTKLVSLRRQQAEQAFAQAKDAVAAAEEELSALEARLRSAPGPVEDFAALSLSERNGHAQRVLKLIEAQKVEIETRKAVLAERRNDLKRAFGSERRLGEIVRPK